MRKVYVRIVPATYEVQRATTPDFSDALAVGPSMDAATAMRVYDALIEHGDIDPTKESKVDKGYTVTVASTPPSIGAVNMDERSHREIQDDTLTFARYGVMGKRAPGAPVPNFSNLIFAGDGYHFIDVYGRKV